MPMRLTDVFMSDFLTIILHESNSGSTGKEKMTQICCSVQYKNFASK